MNNWILWLIAGIISLLSGIFAFNNPFAASMTVELLAAWGFILTGIMIAVSAFNEQGTGGRIVAVILGIIVFAIGINLLLNPLQGVISLTFVVAFLLLFAGILRLLFAFQAGASHIRGVLILSGIISLALSIMIFANFPQSAIWTLGLFLAVELISSGVSLIVLSLARKSATATV